MNRFNATAATAVITIALALTACSPPPLEGVTAYEGATIIPGDGSAPISAGVLVVDHGSISAVGAAGQVEVPAGAARLDVTGKTIMPALIDTHTHVRQTPEALTQDLKQRAYWGVGATLALGTDSADVVAMRDPVMAGAARFFSAGRGITAPEPGRTLSPPFSDPYNIDTPEAGVAAVNEQAALNVDIIKIWVDDRNEQYDKLTPELYGPIIDAAHEKGLAVTAHIHDLSDAKGLLQAGIDSFAHMVRDAVMDEESITLAIQNAGFVQIPNLTGRGVPTDISWLQGVLPDDEFAGIVKGNTVNESAQALFNMQAESLSMLKDAGVTITMGTDGNRAWGAHVEMEDMVATGMTPMEVIVSSTGDAAAFIGADDTGILTSGKSADFLILDGNPLDDITNTRRISSVFLRGEEVDRTVYP